MVSSELEFCLRRAREEARRALRSEQPEVAAAHQRMSVRYSARAFMLRATENDVDIAPNIQRPLLNA